MGNVPLWTYSVILLCVGEITFSQRFPHENPSSGYRNGYSKLNLRNFLGSKLVQRLAEPPQYETYEQPCPCEQQMAPPPPPPQPPQSMPPRGPPLSFSRNLVPYEYSNQRMHGLPPPPPPPLPPSQGMGTPYMAPPLDLGPPPPQSLPPPPPHSLPPPPHHALNRLPPHAMEPLPSHAMSQANMQENVYTETITSTCPCGSCGSCSECEATNRDYQYDEEPCSCCADGRCSCEECHCACRGGGGPSNSGGRSSYPTDKDYPDRDSNYDDYSECPCCCECAGNQGCQCAGYADEPQGPPGRERLSYRGQTPNNQINEHYVERTPETHFQRRESYVTVMGQSSYKPLPPQREAPPHYQQYDEPREPPTRYQPYEEEIEPPQFVKMPPRRSYVTAPDIPPPPPPPPPMHQAPMSFPEEPMQPVPPTTCHMSEIPERTMQRYHEPQPMEPIHQERVNDWRPIPRMAPPPPPRQMIEEEPEPPLPMYRNYRPVPNRFGRNYRQPTKPPFLESLSYADTC